LTTFGSDVDIDEDDLQPYWESRLAWRWRDPHYDVLAPADINAIRKVREAKASEIFRRTLELDRDARETPDATIDMNTLSTAPWKIGSDVSSLRTMSS
jgi:hypothetical protein